MNWPASDLPGPFVLTLTISFLFAFILLRKVKNLGLNKGNHGQLRWSVQKVPTLGGPVLCFSFALGYILYPNEAEGLFPVLPAMFFAFIIGLLDDLRPLSPRLKMSGQIISAMIVLLVSDIDLFSLNAMLLLLILVGMMNSLNMLDNMDGVAATVVLVFFSWIAGSGEIQWPVVVCIPGLLVFLYFNLKPAKMYLGDGGSLLLGLLIGYVGISQISGPQWGSFTLDFVTLGNLCLMFCFPVIDTMLVIVNRLAAGISPAVGGRDHSTHHLVYAGVREGFIPWVYALIASIPWSIVYIFGLPVEWVILYFVVVFGAIFYISRLNISTGKFVYPS